MSSFLLLSTFACVLVVAAALIQDLEIVHLSSIFRITLNKSQECVWVDANALFCLFSCVYALLYIIKTVNIFAPLSMLWIQHRKVLPRK